MAESDYVRTRLTHCLETASIGRSLGTAAGSFICKNFDTAGALASDIGSIVAAAALRAAVTVREIQVSHVQAALRAAATAAAVLWAVARRVAVLRAVHVAVVLQNDEI